MILYKVGRAFQVVGMILLPVGVAGEIAERITLKESLGIAAAGVVVFSLGWLLQQAGRPR